MRTDGTWQANPKPYDQKINLTCDVDNILDLHLRLEGRKVGSPVDFDDPTPELVSQSGMYIRLGEVRSFNKAISVTVQKDIARYVMGTHKNLIKHWPQVASVRQKIWRSGRRPVTGEKQKWVEVDEQPKQQQ